MPAKGYYKGNASVGVSQFGGKSSAKAGTVNKGQSTKGSAQFGNGTTAKPGMKAGMGKGKSMGGKHMMSME